MRFRARIQALSAIISSLQWTGYFLERDAKSKSLVLVLVLFFGLGLVLVLVLVLLFVLEFELVLVSSVQHLVLKLLKFIVMTGQYHNLCKQSF